MAEKISQRVGAISDKRTSKELFALLKAAQADITALRATVAALVVDSTNRLANHNTLIAKLNADAGVTDTDYATGTAQTSSAPSALTFIK